MMTDILIGLLDLILAFIAILILWVWFRPREVGGWAAEVKIGFFERISRWKAE